MHVHRHDHALFFGAAAQGVGNIGSPAVGDQRDIVFLSGLDQPGDLILGFRVHHQIRNTSEVSVFDGVHLFLGVAVAVAEPHFTRIVDLIRIEEPDRLGQELRGLPRFGDGGRIHRRVHFGRVDVHLEDLADPGEETGQFLTAQLIPVAANRDVAVFAEIEAGVAKPPDIEAFRVIRILGGRRVGNDEGPIGIGCRWRGVAIRRIRSTQAVILTSISAFPTSELRGEDSTRISHELSATAPDPSASAAFYGAYLAPGA